MKKGNQHYELDELDKKVAMMLQDDARVHLKTIAKKTGVTIDTIHNRLKELRNKEIIYLTASIDGTKFGFPHVADVKIKLKNITKETKEEFIEYLMKYPQCIDLIELMGSYDFTCILNTQTNEELKNCLDEIRFRFKDIIDEVMSLTVLKAHKLDTVTLN